MKALFTGVAFGVLYEGVRISKMLITSDRGERLTRALLLVFLFLSDFVFCLLFATSAILLTYNISGGVFRGCVYICMALGLLLYRLTIGRLTEKIERLLTSLIKKLILGTVRLFLIPLRAIFSLLCRIYSLTIGRIIGKIICRVKEDREKKRIAREGNSTAPPCLQSPREEVKEEDNNAECARGYKKEDRIRFPSYGRRDP
jgi:hypothetical protein